MQKPDISRGRVIINRWRVLAEARLDYLTELYESGRWRRYFTEQAFLENIREAKTAVETWRMLASQEALADNTPLDLSWLESRRPVPVAQPRLIAIPDTAPQRPSFAGEVKTPAPPPLPTRSDIRVQMRVEAVAAPPPAEAPARPETSPFMDWRMGLDLATLKQRYSLLRNAV